MTNKRSKFFRWANSPPGSGGEFTPSLAFLNHNNRTGRNIAQTIELAAGPADLDAIGSRGFSKAERQYPLALRKVTRAASGHFGLRFTPHPDPHHRAETILVRSIPDQANPQTAVISAIVA